MSAAILASAATLTAAALAAITRLALAGRRLTYATLTNPEGTTR